MCVYYLYGDVSPMQPPPPLSVPLQEVNYDQNFALLVLEGITGSGSSMHLQQITRQGCRIVVRVASTRPKPGGQVAVVSDPYQLVILPKAGLLGQQLRVELWDGWWHVKTIAARVGDLPLSTTATVTPWPPDDIPVEPTRDYPAQTEEALPPPEPAGYPAPSVTPASSAPYPAPPTRVLTE